MNEAVFEEAKTKFPPGHSKDSSSFPISNALYSFARLIQPSHIVEVGTFEGATSIWLARALEENRRGSFTGYEVHAGRAQATRENLERAVPGGNWEVKACSVLDEPYIETDFLFLDCDKALYPKALGMCLIPVNGYVFAHDTAAWPQAIQFYKYMKVTPEYEVVSVHTELGLMIARKVA